MRYLVISDVHLRWSIVGGTITRNKNNYDKVLFLGDYFDDFGANEYDYIDTCKWLKDSIYDENKIFLLGNHDIAYLSSYNKVLGETHYYRCSGYSDNWFRIIQQYLTLDDWKQFKLYHFIKDDVFCSHAGLSGELYNFKKINNLKEFIENEASIGLNRIIQNSAPIDITNVGQSRGGLKPIGGITWCDYFYDFSIVPNLSQIFGHTPLQEPDCTIYDDNYFTLALDTHNKHYALYDSETNKIKIKEIID